MHRWRSHCARPAASPQPTSSARPPAGRGPMRRRMMKSKLHRARVTDANLDYVGSVTIDHELMERADIRPFEQVAVFDVDNGARFETYPIAGGPRVIILTYADYSEDELEHYVPRIVHVDSRNKVIDKAAARVEVASLGFAKK